jgi:hypothetical protein
MARMFLTATPIGVSSSFLTCHLHIPCGTPRDLQEKLPLRKVKTQQREEAWRIGGRGVFKKAGQWEGLVA